MLFAQNKEVISLREDHDQLVEMKTEVQHLRALEQAHRLSTDRITELELIIAQLTKELEREKLEKQSAVNEKEVVKKESELVGSSLCFLVRDSIYAIARYMPSPVRPSVRLSVCLSVCHTGGSVKDG